MTEKLFEPELTGDVEGRKPEERISSNEIEEAKFVDIKEEPENGEPVEIESETQEYPPEDILLYGFLSEETKEDALKELRNLQSVLESAQANPGSTYFENYKAKFQKLMQDPVGYYTDKTDELNKFHLQFPKNEKVQKELEKYTRITIELQNRKESIDLKKKIKMSEKKNESAASAASEKTANKKEQTKQTGEELIRSGDSVVPYEVPDGQQEIGENSGEKDKFFWLQEGQKELISLNVGDLAKLSEQEAVVAEDFAEMLHGTGLSAHHEGNGKLSVDFTDMDSFPHLAEEDKRELEYFNHTAAFLVKGNKEREGGKLKIDIKNNLLEESYKTTRDIAVKILTRTFAEQMRRSGKDKKEVEEAIANHEAAERAKIDARVRVAQFLRSEKGEKENDRVSVRTILMEPGNGEVPRFIKNDLREKIFSMAKGKVKKTDKLFGEAVIEGRVLSEQLENYKTIRGYSVFEEKAARLLEDMKGQIKQIQQRYGDVIDLEKLPYYLK